MYAAHEVPDIFPTAAIQQQAFMLNSSASNAAGGPAAHSSPAPWANLKSPAESAAAYAATQYIHELSGEWANGLEGPWPHSLLEIWCGQTCVACER